MSVDHTHWANSNLSGRTRLPHRIVAASFLVAGLMALAACGRDGAQQQGGPQAPQVAVSTPVQKSVREWDEYTGRFVAVDRVEIRARVSGYLNSIHFKDGDVVYKGDLLFVIDPRPYEASLNAAKARLQQAQAQLQLATRELQRAENLRRTQAVSEAVLDERQQQVRNAQGSVLAAEAAVRTAELDIEFTQVKAPVTGRISQRLVGVGNLVSGGQANSTLLTTIVSLDPIHFVFDADQQAYLRYVKLARSGERASSREVDNPVILALPGEADFPHVGRMDFVDNEIDPSTGTIRARAIFSNSDMTFTPGLFARLRLVGRNEYQALLLPDAAVGTDQTRRFVYVIGENNVPQVRPVVLGPIIDGLRVVREGLSPTDRVVTAGVQRIRPGAPVTPVDAPIQAPTPTVPTAPVKATPASVNGGGQ